ncbi:MAG: flavin reductase [Actinobacteria bacterium]|nr:flavin reductase [Actinomycetota bacterium]MCB8997337.1 flavin reductase [Actinomycetota bacterium]MCB9414125.1 flavin reductase [Actinomycetota bacterium]HRY10998.1 flavin reductase family protein [Candidatus Nanopelagicales bacterium]
MRDAFKGLMARVASGVVVVTARVGDEDHAMTANSFTSVSLDPQLVLFCVQQDSRFHDAIHAAPRWVVNLLSAQQAPAARWFAERGRPLAGQMSLVEFERDDDGIAVLTGSIGHLGCTTEEIHPAGDHSIVVGRVQRIVYENLTAPPLVYLDHRLG